MTRIDFYIIEEGSNPVSEEATETFICRLTEKAWSQNNSIYIHALNESQTVKLDELLWTVNENSFIPHQISENIKQDNAGNPVLIGHQTTTEIPTSHYDVLINLNHDTPSFFSQFDRVAEIITADETSRSKGRERYQFYRDRGYPLETHKLSL